MIITFQVPTISLSHAKKSLIRLAKNITCVCCTAYEESPYFASHRQAFGFRSRLHKKPRDALSTHVAAYRQTYKNVRARRKCLPRQCRVASAIVIIVHLVQLHVRFWSMDGVG